MLNYQQIFLFLELQNLVTSTDLLTLLGRLCLHLDSLETGEETKRLFLKVLLNNYYNVQSFSNLNSCNG